jgi:sugar phosphate isomerase/epimerase
MMAQDLRFAARLNAFKLGLDGKPGLDALLARVALVPDMTAADLNFPDHLVGVTPAKAKAALDRHGIALNGLAMRYYTHPGFRLGAFTNPDPTIRRAAIDETKRGLDALAEMGGSIMTLWMGQDGVDYSFQGDYIRMWEDTIAAIAEVADHNQSLDISIEYKPNEPRAFALMPDLATTLLALDEVARSNTGVTLDFCHLLFAGELPARSVRLATRRSRLLGIHLNDGYGKRDDGLMVGSVHPVQTVELFVEMMRQGPIGTIYFDTFPDHGGLDPVAEAATNIAMTRRLWAIARELVDQPELANAIARQDAAESLRIVAEAVYAK